MKVAIIMGSKSDYDVVGAAEDVLDKFGVDYDTRIISAHRTPDTAAEFARTAEQNGYEVIICAAGKAAHLAQGIRDFSTVGPQKAMTFINTKPKTEEKSTKNTEN